MKSFYCLKLINLGCQVDNNLYRNLYEDIFMDLKFVEFNFYVFKFEKKMRII